jgi:hypothetical protein
MVAPTDLYSRIRDRLDLAEASYLDNDEIGQLCEESYFELWDFLIATLKDESPWERLTLTTTPGQDYADVTIAQGVYRLLRVDFKGNTDFWRPVQRLQMASDEIDGSTRSWESHQSFRYFARRSLRAGNSLRTSGGFSAWRFHFSPTPAAAYQVRLHYVPPPAIGIGSGSETTYTSFPDEFPEYVVADVCAKLMVKQELSPADFERERERIKFRIESFATPNDAAGPRFISDGRQWQGPDRDPFWRRR